MKNLSLLILIFTPSVSYAYLDPGSFSLILQGLIAGLAAVIGFFSQIRFKLISLIKNLFKIFKKTK